MFTGIVEEIGTLVAVEARDEDARLEMSGPVVVDGTRLGDSIAVDGVCLTVTSITDGRFTVDAMPETLRRSTLGRLAPGSPVNRQQQSR